MSVIATKRRRLVSNFAELARRPFSDGVNALCWPRALGGDFGEVARLLAPDDGLVVVEPTTLAALDLSDAGRTAAEAMLDDLLRLRELGHDPVINCIARYARDQRGLPIATDVMSFHVDRAPVEVDTWLCTYWGKSTEGIDNDDAQRLIDSPALRLALLQEYGGGEDEHFATFITTGSYDLHYGAVDDVEPFSFGVGHLWRVAVQWAGCPVPP